MAWMYSLGGQVRTAYNQTNRQAWHATHTSPRQKSATSSTRSKQESGEKEDYSSRRTGYGWATWAKGARKKPKEIVVKHDRVIVCRLVYKERWCFAWKWHASYNLCTVCVRPNVSGMPIFSTFIQGNRDFTQARWMQWNGGASDEWWDGRGEGWLIG